MTLSEFEDIIKFAKGSIEKRTDKPISIRVIVNLSKAKKQTSVVLDINEVGFDDKSATIYIEV